MFIKLSHVSKKILPHYLLKKKNPKFLLKKKLFLKKRASEVKLVYFKKISFPLGTNMLQPSIRVLCP